jgi:hypothetical protein
MEAEGHGATVRFDGQTVTLLPTVGNGKKSIPLSSIIAVQWKPAGRATKGFIQFTVPGDTESRSRSGSQTTNAVADENSVVFTRSQAKDFEQLRDAVQVAIDASHAMPPSEQWGSSVGDELLKLVDLRDAGMLDESEFAAQKAKLLG